MKKIMHVFGSFILLIVFIVLVYGIYLSSSYYRIEDLKEYDIEEQVSQEKVELNQIYSVATFNLGFGAYDHDFSFFMETGEMLDGTKTKGKNAKASSKDVVIENINACLEEMAKINSDFMLFQEVDYESTRSFKVNQVEMIKEKFSTYNTLFVSNFHSKYLFYPILDPHGSVESGLVTTSNKYIDKTIRHKLEINESFPTQFTDLDRCFTASYLPINNSDKYLVLVNVHLSAYDKGGVYRAKQVEQLNKFFEEEIKKGNYLVCGGDFNHNIVNDESFKGFPTTQKTPGWVYSLTNEDITTSGMSIVSNYNVPTCRSSNMPYTRGHNYTAVIDGFIISDNVEILSIQNIDLDFRNSDHNPVCLEFILK